MAKYHAHLDNFPEIPELFVNLAATAQYRDVAPPGLPAVPALMAPCNFKNSKFCGLLNQQFGTEVTSSFIRNPPNTVFDWRADFGSSCAVTFVLSDIPHLIYFVEHSDSRLNVPIESVGTHLRRPTVVDATQRHCVVNHSDQARYMLHVGIKSVPYADVVGFLTQCQPSADIYSIT